MLLEDLFHELNFRRVQRPSMHGTEVDIERPLCGGRMDVDDQLDLRMAPKVAGHGNLHLDPIIIVIGVKRLVLKEHDRSAGQFPQHHSDRPGAEVCTLGSLAPDVINGVGRRDQHPTLASDEAEGFFFGRGGNFLPGLEEFVVFFQFFLNGFTPAHTEVKAENQTNECKNEFTIHFILTCQRAFYTSDGPILSSV